MKNAVYYSQFMKHAKKVVSPDSTRPVLQGVYHGKDGTLAATDSYHLLFVENCNVLEGEVIIDPKKGTFIEGNFPNVERLIPEEYKYEVWEKTKPLLEFHKAVVNITKSYIEKQDPYVELDLSSMTFSFECEDKESLSYSTREVSGYDVFRILYNAQFVVNALNLFKDIGSEAVRMKFISPVHPFVITNEEGVTFLILPIRAGGRHDV